LAVQFAAIVDRAFHVAPFDAPMLTAEHPRAPELIPA
jgi:hypothetical protein